MTGVMKVAVFLLGMYLSIRVVAALYGIIDFRYRIKTAYPRVVRGILGWGILTVAIAFVLTCPYRPAFLWGLVAFVVLQVSAICLNKFLAQRAMGRPKTNDAPAPQSRP